MSQIITGVEIMYKISIRSSASIKDTIAAAIGVAKVKDASVEFRFNTVIITVREDSSPELIERDFVRAIADHISRNIGPYPETNLSEKEWSRYLALMERKKERA